MPCLTLSDPESEERQLLARGVQVEVFENNPEYRAQVQADAEEYGFKFGEGKLGQPRTHATAEGYNGDHCCGPRVFLRDVCPYIHQIQPRKMRSTLTYSGRTWLEPVDVHDREGALQHCQMVANLIEAAVDMRCEYFDVYHNQATGRGRFWMFYLLFNRETKFQKAARKAWVTRRANCTG